PAVLHPARLAICFVGLPGCPVCVESRHVPAVCAVGRVGDSGISHSVPTALHPTGGHPHSFLPSPVPPHIPGTVEYRPAGVVRSRLGGGSTRPTGLGWGGGRARRGDQTVPRVSVPLLPLRATLAGSRLGVDRGGDRHRSYLGCIGNRRIPN